MYDIIGDIHGQAEALRRLLRKLGYRKKAKVWEHPQRRVIFVGDFVDRGPDIREVLEVARPMIDEGTALAVMGNHEFNNIALNIPDPREAGKYLRRRSHKNLHQAKETREQLAGELLSYCDWFRELPLWLDLGDLRVVHACWDENSMEVVKNAIGRHGSVNAAFMAEASIGPSPGEEHGSELYEAVEILIKGREERLPDGMTFEDGEKNVREHVRTRWYLEPKGLTWKEYAFASAAQKKLIPEGPVPSATTDHIRGYPDDAPPVFFGHYWMSPDVPPAPLKANVACIDYSVARPGGKLCAYRWNGESRLEPASFETVDRPDQP